KNGGGGVHQCQFPDPATAVTGHVADNDGAAEGKTDQGGPFQLQRIKDGVQIVGQPVVGVAVPGLVGPAEPPHVQANAAEAVPGQHVVLVFKHVVVDRPAVDEHDRAASFAGVDVPDEQSYALFNLNVHALSRLSRTDDTLSGLPSCYSLTS